MKLYTLKVDKKSWRNRLDPATIEQFEYSDEQIAEFRKSADAFVLKDHYVWSWENDYEEKRGDSVIYHKIDSEQMLVYNGKFVGAIFVTKHNDSAMSNVINYDFDAVYIDKANEKLGERWNDKCSIYYSAPSSEDECDMSIIKISDVPVGWSIKPIPLSNLINK